MEVRQAASADRGTGVMPELGLMSQQLLGSAVVVPGCPPDPCQCISGRSRHCLEVEQQMAWGAPEFHKTIRTSVSNARKMGKLALCWPVSPSRATLRSFRASCTRLGPELQGKQVALSSHQASYSSGIGDTGVASNAGDFIDKYVMGT